MDSWLLDFIKENVITMSIILAILKVIAIETPWAADDKIIEILTGIFKK
jgi:hypothetical protein